MHKTFSDAMGSNIFELITLPMNNTDQIELCGLKDDSCSYAMMFSGKDEKIEIEE
jgi:hypothetical protein